MSIRLRLIQRYDITREKEFLELERQFADLERRRPDFPKGVRLKPLAAGEPTNTLIWEGTFPDIAAARKVLEFFSGDPEHEALFAKQLPLFESQRIEFYETLFDE